MNEFGWRTVYVVFGAFAGVAVLTAGRLLPGPLPVMGGAAADPPASTTAAPRRGGLSRRTLLLTLLSLAWAAQGFVMIGNTAHLQAHITDLGFSTGEAALTVGILAGAGVLGSFVMGFAADRFGAWAAFTGGFVAALVGVTGLAFVDGLLPIAAMALVLGLGAYGIGTVLPALAADLFGLAALGAMLGLLELWWSIGAWLGPIYFGTTFDATGTYTLAYATAAVVTAGALLLCPLLRPGRRVGTVDPVDRSDLGLSDVDRDPGGAAGARGDRPIAL
jgi:MFS family permease